MTANVTQAYEYFEPVTLTGSHVQLVPLAPEHHDGLVAAVEDGEAYKLWFTNVPSPEMMQTAIDRCTGMQAAGSMLPFTVLDAAGQVAGMTTYMNMDTVNRRVEIGATWYAARVRRTALNTEAKFLLLQHAFERLGCIAVEFRTHVLNQASRRAIERLGAKFDGILRSHTIASNGTVRDTAVYSIIASEWPAVRAHLLWQLEKPR